MNLFKEEYDYVTTSPVTSNGKWRWVYGYPGPIGAGFEIEVAMKDNRMMGVYVEHADLRVYKCNEKECPVVYKYQLLDRLSKQRN